LTEEGGKHPPRNGEILPPERDQDQGENAGLSQTWLAQVNNYTDRPDLLIAEIEKHDPGFVKRMNDAAEKDSAELRSARFKFGKVQAYAALGVSVVAALAVLGAIFYAIHSGAGFGTLIALAAVYAVSQGGSRGFSRLVEAVSEHIGRGKGDKPKE
jgi:hypothetical protein